MVLVVLFKQANCTERASPWIPQKSSWDLPPSASSWPNSRAARKTRPYGPGWRSDGCAAPNCTIGRVRLRTPAARRGGIGRRLTARPTEGISVQQPAADPQQRFARLSRDCVRPARSINRLGGLRTSTNA